MSAQELPSKKRSRLGGLQRALLTLLVLVFVGSLGARAWFSSQPAKSNQSPQSGGELNSAQKEFFGSKPDFSAPGSHAFSAAEAPPSTNLEKYLPFVTEGSFFGLIGFALGYISRKIMKVGLIFIAVFFLGIQGLVYGGLIEKVDWPKAIQYINNLVLNLKENKTFTQWITDRVPTAGALIAGYLVGLKRG